MRSWSIRRIHLIVAGVLLVSILAACGGTVPQSNHNNQTEKLSDTPKEQPVNVVGEKKEAIHLLNVSYDPTREFYSQYNEAFAKYWKSIANQDVTIEQSHGGS